MPDAADRAVQWLVRQQHPDGRWSDFFLEPGTSTGWVTGYVGTAVAHAAADPRLARGTRALAAASADRATSWLGGQATSDGGWAYLPGLRPDADSTAWAVQLLAARAQPIGPATWDFLAAHRDQDGGYRTYRSAATSGRWAGATAEVTAAVLLAHRAGGRLADADLDAGLASIAGQVGRAGWRSLWWAGPGYVAAIVAELCRTTGRRLDLPAPDVGTSAFELAGAAWAAAGQVLPHRHSGSARTTGRELLGRLVGLQRGGGWPGGADLLVPAARDGAAPDSCVDARGVFTTATGLRALLAHPRRPPSVGRRGVAGAGRTRQTGYDDAVLAMAGAAGIDTRAAVPVHRALTRRSLDGAVRWPAPQLSTLAGGGPIEFSVGAEPSLRLTTEVGDPGRPPRQRLLTGLADLRHAAAVARLSGTWRRAETALRVLANPGLPVPPDNRFWLWGGLDADTRGQLTLKAYASLLAEDLDGAGRRLDAFLDACTVPRGAAAREACRVLDEHGWVHEAGVGATARGWGAKIYFELHGFRPDLLTRVLRIAGLDDDPEQLTPEVPGVLKASLAAKSRAGIALRVVPQTGAIAEVTVAAAFPAPMVGRAELARRVQHWLDGRGSGAAHRAAVAALLPGWHSAPAMLRMHSLFTLSRSARGDAVKVYLRPGG